MKRVIIAEDIHEVLRAEQSFLCRSDIKVVTAGSNTEVLALHKTEKADLIIAKLDDRELSGEKLCSGIRRDDTLRGVSIIIVCSGDESDLRRCVKCSANAFVTSPLNNATLLQEAYQLLHVAQRKSCRIKVKVKLEGTTKSRPFTAEAEDISTAGMLLRLSAELLEGDPLVVSFSFPGSGRLSATAEVVRVLPKQKGRTPGYGISFIELGPDALSAIEALAAAPAAEGCSSG
ncbi:MAG: PilZ domain-containing protein [Nitrospiraceae bacterium]|nr:PilZ domain-containing protein [Nitrospiraceae bacterium]